MMLKLLLLHLFNSLLKMLQRSNHMYQRIVHHNKAAKRCQQRIGRKETEDCRSNYMLLLLLLLKQNCLLMVMQLFELICHLRRITSREALIPYLLTQRPLLLLAGSLLGLRKMNYLLVQKLLLLLTLL